MRIRMFAKEWRSRLFDSVDFVSGNLEKEFPFREMAIKEELKLDRKSEENIFSK